jgi:hypothetical protein
MKLIKRYNLNILIGALEFINDIKFNEKFHRINFYYFIYKTIEYNKFHIYCFLIQLKN